MRFVDGSTHWKAAKNLGRCSGACIFICWGEGGGGRGGWGGGRGAYGGWIPTPRAGKLRLVWLICHNSSSSNNNKITRQKKVKTKMAPRYSTCRVEQYKHLPVHKRKIIENTVSVRRQNFKHLPCPSNISVWFPSSKVLHFLFKLRKNQIVRKIRVKIGSPRPLTRQRVLPSLPLVPGGTHSLGGEGAGGANSDEGTDTLVL